MAAIVGFISQKGGVGKTTLARALAREAAVAGLRVKIADLDTMQGTAVEWQRRRLQAGIEPTVSVESFRTAQDALAEANRYDLLILDGPARADSATVQIAQNADLVVQPTSPSVDDLHPAILTFHQLVRAGIPQERLALALVRGGTDAEDEDARHYVARAGYILLVGALHERPAYRQAQNAGYAVTETRYGTLNKRAEALIQDLIDRIAQDDDRPIAIATVA